MLISLLAAATILVGSDPDEVVATAPKTPVSLDVGAAPIAPSVGGAAQEAAPHGLTTDQQIDRWLESRDPAAAPFAQDVYADDREPHGEFSATVGTHGYRDFGAAVSLPLGEHGRLDLSYRQVENGYYGYGWGDPWDRSRGYVLPGLQSGALATFEGRPQRRDDAYRDGLDGPADRRP